MSTTFKQDATPVKLGDIVRVTNFAGNPSSDHIGKIVTINRLSRAEGTSYVYYGTEERSPANLERGEFVVLPEVKHEYKKDDRVQITIPEGNNDTYGGRYFVTGGGTVLNVDVEGGRTLLQVKADTKHPLRSRRNDWWVDTKFVTPLAEELPFEVGARVRSKAGYVDVGSEGTVTRLEGDFGGDIEIAWETGYAVAGLTLGARRSGLEVIASPVVERPAVKVGDTIISKCVWGDYVAVGTRCIVVTPNGGGTLTARVEGSADTFAWYFSSESEYELVETKSKAIPATETKPQIGDTIVAFWGDLSKGEVETRAKGVVARIDEDGNYEAADGSCIDWDEEFSPETSDSVFIVERAPKPEPVKVDPNQKWIDAPIGSIALLPIHEFQWLKTAWNEWTFFNTKTGGTFKDRTDADINSTNGTQLVTF